MGVFVSESIYRALRGLSRRESRSKVVKSKFIETPFGKIYLAYISSAALSVVIIIVWKLTQLVILKLLSLTFLLLSYIGCIYHPLVLIFYHRRSLSEFFKNPLYVIYENAKCKHQIDSQYLSYFMSKENQALELVHLELVAEKDAFEKRISLVVGAIKNVGLLPGVLALLLSLDKFKNIELDWVLTIAYAVPLFYGFGVFGHILITKMSRHILLLEYVLEKNKKVGDK